MAKCLVTKLAESVNNPSLLKLGEIKVQSNITKNDDYIRIEGSSEKPVTLKLETGYFRSSKTDTTNIGTELVVKSRMEVYPSIGEHIVSVIPKYNINYIQNVMTNIDDLKFSKDLDVLIANSDSYGDLASLKDLKSMTSLKLLPSKVKGNISSLSSLVNLSYFELSSTENITGDIAALKSLSKLNTLKIKVDSVFGDLASLPENCRFASLNKNAQFTWGTRQPSSKILAIEGAPKINNIDKMLQDQAACQSGITTSDYTYYKTIEVTGTRTSASDAAVQTLQSKGYTVSITPA